MQTLPMGYLFGIKNNKVEIKNKMFVPCDRYHPDTARIVVLSESPCQENNFKSATVSARYIGGQYHGVTTGDQLPVILDHTVWTESSIAEGPFQVINNRTGERYGDVVYEDLQSALNHANNLTMQMVGVPGYLAANQYGIPVDHTGHLYF